MNEKVKIVYLINDVLLGGAQRIALDIAQNFNRDLFDWQLVYCKSNSLFPEGSQSLLDDYKKTGIKITSLDGDLKFSWREAKNLKNHLKKEKPDIIHTTLPYSNILGRVIGRLSGIKNILCTQCNVPGVYPSKTRFLDKLTMPLMKVAVSATEGIQKQTFGIVEYFSKEAYEEGERNFIVRAGVGIAKIDAVLNAINKNEKRKLLGLSLEDKVVTMTARLEKWKGQKELVNAFALVTKKVPGAKLILVGGGHQEENLKRQVKELNIQDRVLFLGPRRDNYEILASSDLFISAHITEGEGGGWEGPNTAMLEAMAMGLPIVSTTVPRIELALEDGKNGFLVPQKDDKAMAEKIVWCLENSSQAKAMGQASRQRVIDNYSAKSMVDTYQQIYQLMVL